MEYLNLFDMLDSFQATNNVIIISLIREYWLMQTSTLVLAYILTWI